MDISAISTFIGARSFSDSAATTAGVEKLPRENDLDDARHKHDHQRHRGIGRRGHALEAFKQELRTRLNARLVAKYAFVQNAYDGQKPDEAGDEIAAAAIGEARQIAAQSPTTAEKSIVAFRAAVHETADTVRDTLGDGEDYTELDGALATVDEALSALEGAAARNLESSASVLSVDTRSKQRSTIRIRTQEGDTVRLSLKSFSRLSANDSAVSENGNFASVTEVELSSRSRLSLRVEGDINDAELAAIQNVLAQATKIANEFFDGDIAAAFDLAAGFEFDTEQLARVKLGFRSQVVSRISYTEAVHTAPAPVSDNVTLAPAAPARESSPDEAATVAEEPPAIEQQQDQSPTAEPSALADFLDSLGAFLRTIGEGFSAESSSIQYHYSESFKLQLLSAVIHTIAPPESDQAATSAGAIIDAIDEAASRDDRTAAAR